LLVLGTGLWALYAGAARLSYAPPPQAIAATLCLPRCSDTEPIHPAPAGEDGPGRNRLGEGRSLQSLLPPDFSPDNISILIEKADHRLTVYHQLQPIKSYSVVFGGAPVGDKRYEGDRKTPEGILRVKDLYPHPDWSKFIWLDYPNPTSWRRHIAAKLQGKIPLSATVGSDLGIHGVPANHSDIIERRINWTLGCPSLKNEDVDEIYQVIQVGTLVEIRP
jgi:hypothetical protein